MKKRMFFLTVIVSFITVGAMAQTQSQVVFNKSHAPKKGYYAIGNNADKYNPGHTTPGNTRPTYNKGYYAQAKHQQIKLDSTGSNLVITNRRSMPTKGYYTQAKFQKVPVSLPANNNSDTASVAINNE